MPAASSMQLLGSQWFLTRIQLINWGTFDGYHDLRIRPTDRDGDAAVVCITGRSGTGKSTLFDAGTVLMMPYGRTLNAASNLGRGGSPREVRTYLRGMVDTVADERGRSRGKYLRDENAPIWSAIVHTWEDSIGSVFSAARFFQLRPGGGEGDLVQTLVTMEGPLDPRSLRSYATTRLRSRDVLAVYPGCVVHDGSGRFFHTIYQTLGIGADSNGTNAMKLMYRIQSGIPMTNVDELFKELVLDPPSTFEAAQSVIENYDQSQSVWRSIEEARRKREMLAGIDTWYADLLGAREELRLAESMAHGSKEGPFRLWLERHRLSLAEDERLGTEAALARSRNAEQATRERRARHEEELESLREEMDRHGGSGIRLIRAKIDSLVAERGGAERRLVTLRELLKPAEQEEPTSREAWDALEGWADDTSASYEQRHATLQEQIDDAGTEASSAKKAVDELESELGYYRAHRTRITPQMAAARERMAQAAGLDPQDIPFAAELMDVPREQELWRVAVNISLAHIADRILVDKSLERAFRSAVDPLASQLGRRYHYDFVDLDEDWLCTPKPGHVSSKVIYRDDSPFAPYVRQLVCNHTTDHLCVDTVGKLQGEGPRITPSGQERVGNRGAIGHSRNTLIIGFSNDMLIEDLEAELDDARTRQAGIMRARNALVRQRGRLDAEASLARHVRTLSWDEVDVAGRDAQLAELRADLERLEQDDELRVLRDKHDQTKARIEEEIGELRELEGDIADKERWIAALEMLVDQARLVVDGLSSQGVSLTDAQAELAGASVAQSEATLGDRASILRHFDRVEGGAHTFFDGLIRKRSDERDRLVRQLETAFANYHGTFMPDDAEHGTGTDEYPYYHSVLVELEQQRLDEPEAAWEAQMLRDVGSHLSRLSDAFTREERAIGERLRPVNEILGQFTFGERRGRLGVVSERRTLSDVTNFRRTLRHLSSLATRYDYEGGEDEVRREHRALSRFVDLLRQDLASTGKGARHYLDTRHMVRISARETVPGDPSAEPVVYDSINGKSGGQYQELVAFILGAALLYCLGQNAATKPTYAPLFLDEAFIKADSDHTRRALGALSGLGFQVIIAVPDGKVEAVVPLASQIIGLSKSPQTNTTHARSLMRAGTDEDGEPTWED